MRPALDYARDHAGLLEHPQVLGDRRLGHSEAAGGLTDGGGTSGEALDDPAPDRVRERSERIVNHKVNDSTLDCFSCRSRLACSDVIRGPRGDGVMMGVPSGFGDLHG